MAVRPNTLFIRPFNPGTPSHILKNGLGTEIDLLYRSLLRELLIGSDGKMISGFVPGKRLLV